MEKKLLKSEIQFWAAIATFISLIMGLIALYLTFRSLQQDIEMVKKQTTRSHFRITYPTNGANVELTSLIQGDTPYSDRNHYIVVTPIKTGDNFVQDGPIEIDAGGLWTGLAKFGAAAVGLGENFIVRVIATESILSPGPLTEVPEDAIFSESITVKRIK